MTVSSQFSFLSRRHFLLGTTGLLALTGPSQAAAALDDLTLFGPPAGPSIVLAVALAQGRLASLAKNVRLKLWANPDEMRAGIVSGSLPLAVMPITAAASLYNRGFGLRLLNTMTDGLLYIVTANPALQTLPHLKNKRLAAPFGNDLPNFVLSRVLARHGMAEARDLDIMVTGTPIESVQLLLSGRADAALLPEPSATAAELKGKSAGKPVHRLLDLQAEWGKITGLDPILPQAGIGVTDSFLRSYPETVTQLATILEAVATEVRQNPAQAASVAAGKLDLPEAVLTAAIPHCKLVCRRAQTARPALEASFRAILEANPGGIGGKLPDDAFYL